LIPGQFYRQQQTGSPPPVTQSDGANKSTASQRNQNAPANPNLDETVAAGEPDVEERPLAAILNEVLAIANFGAEQ
jgi:hypothetical protein